jgi:phosphoenolpyruvate carboxylase
MPPGVLRGRLRITEQGESIRERYGLRPIAMRTFERAISAVTLATAGVDGGRPVQPRWLEAMDIVAREAAASYRAIVHDDPSFLEYFQSVTPVDVIERMQIGSRPVTRAAGGGVESYRSIPWAFAWSQSRHMLPGWLGVSAGLGAAVDAVGIGVLRGMYAEWPWFESLLDDVETVLARADMGVAAFYEQLARPEHARYSRVLGNEYRATVERVLAVKEATQLLDADPTMQRIIRLRNPYVDPLHLSQVDLLQRWRESDRQDRELLEALIASVNGIAQGLQASG